MVYNQLVNAPRVIDLFCGCGGMSWGAKQAGFEIIAGLDNDKNAIQTYRQNFGAQAGQCLDITSASPQTLMQEFGLKVGSLELLVGGPPCQGFSKNVPRSQRQLNDPRNMLVKYFLEFAEVFQPKTIIMENVAEMKNGFGGAYTSEILERLELLGYNVKVEVLQSASFGVPQRRKRAFVLANRLGFPISFPDATHAAQASDSLFSSQEAYVNVEEAIGDLPTLQHGEGNNVMSYSKPISSKFQQLMRQNATILHDHFARQLQETQVKRLESIVAGQGARDLPLELRPKSHYSGAYGRLSWDDLAPTITRWVFHPGSGRFSHPVDTRTITIREAARLQSFSDDFVFTGSYIQKSHQVGNAVPPLLMKAIAAIALEWLKSAYARENLVHSNVRVAPQNEMLVGAD